MENTKSSKIWFLHLLRGVACLIVVYSHIFYVFWVKYKIVSTFWQGENLSIDTENNIILSINNYLTNQWNIGFGILGVSLFFLISGFVIPVSLEKIKGIPFFINRFTRIYPTYIAGLLILCCSMLAYCFYTDQHWQYGLKNILLNASLLFRDWTSIQSMDGINWTLEIEVKFYILMGILVQFFDIKKARVAIITALSLLGLHFFTFLPPLHILMVKAQFIANFNCFFLTYMLIGTGFYNFYKKNFDLKKLVFYIITLTIICYLCTLNNEIFKENASAYYLNCTLAFLIFIAFYLIKDRLVPNKILNFTANISYPLYVVHGFNSYILMSVIYKYIQNFYICAGTALFVSILQAYIVQ